MVAKDAYDDFVIRERENKRIEIKKNEK